MSTIVINATHGPEDPERATLPFVVGNVAAGAGQRAIVLLTIEGAWLALEARRSTVAAKGLPPLPDIVAQFLAAGGEIWACGACTTPRGITEADLGKGARIVSAMQVVEELSNAARTLSF
jgi:predicted peroxiredoxin